MKNTSDHYMDAMKKEACARILEAFAYIADHAPSRKRNMYNVLKVFYLADKIHMERFGRFIFDDSYSAMAKGPVPSKAYDLMKSIRDGSDLPFDMQSPVSLVDDNIVQVNRQANEDLFSGSDLACLDEIINLSETKDLGDLSHDEAWEKTKRNSRMSIESILSTLKNSDVLIDLHRNRHP